MVRKNLKFFIICLLFISCNQSEPEVKSVEIREPEEILVEIMESYQNFSKDPDKSVEIIPNVKELVKYSNSIITQIRNRYNCTLPKYIRLIE